MLRYMRSTAPKTHTKQLIPSSKANTGGLVSELHLAIGAKVMLTAVNIDVLDGLVNGARGQFNTSSKLVMKSASYLSSLNIPE